MTESEWIKKQGKCCLCNDDPEYADDMDNVYCEAHWVDYLEEDEDRGECW